MFNVYCYIIYHLSGFTNNSIYGYFLICSLYYYFTIFNLVRGKYFWSSINMKYIQHFVILICFYLQMRLNVCSCLFVSFPNFQIMTLFVLWNEFFKLILRTSCLSSLYIWGDINV